MFYGATPSIFEKTKMLRQNMTKQESTLWEELRSNKVLGLRFKPQHLINTFIADFYCHKMKLVIEIDGNSHRALNAAEYDEGREVEMQKLGISTLRFTNQQVDDSLGEVVRKIESSCIKIRKKKKLELNQPSTPTKPWPGLKGEADSTKDTSPLQGVGGDNSLGNG